MTIKLPRRVEENIGRFTGRAWLLPEVLTWWEKNADQRLFLITGGPGTGKSMIIAWLAGFGPLPHDPLAQAQLVRIRALRKAAHFCDDKSGSTDPKKMACNMAEQLTRNVPGFGDALAAMLGEQVQIASEQHVGHVSEGGSVTGVYIVNLDLSGLSEELSFNRILRDPLEQLYKDGYDEPMLLLLDALDESMTYTGGTNIVQLLDKLTDLPPQVRILTTTRDDPRVLKLFRQIKPFDLIRDASPDEDDVQVYARQRLSKLAALGEARLKDFADRLAGHARGTFLYAALVLDELLGRPFTELPDLENYHLPDGFSGLYHDFLNRELGKDERLWFDLYEPLLGLIAVAQGDGLTTRQLSNITGKDIRASLRASKQYLSGELPEGPFRPFHKSFADFLLDDENNLDYRIDALTMHSLLVKHYLNTYQRDWTDCDQYGLRHLPTHLGELRAWTELGELLLNLSFIRAVSDFSHGALADGFKWVEQCANVMPAGSQRNLLLDLGKAADRLRNFIDRAVEIRTIESFLQMEKARHLVVVSGPGTGKTALLTRVWLRNCDHCVLVRCGPEISMAKGGSLAAALVTQALRALQPLFAEDLDRYPPEALVGYSRLYESVERYGGAVCVIFDEFDAVASHPWATTDLPRNPPPNLRFIWGSRSTPILEQLRSEAEFLILGAPSAMVIKEFCRKHLEARLSSSAVERILAISDGLPLYLALIEQQIDTGELAESALELDRIPSSLADFYEARTRRLEAGAADMRDLLISLVRAMVDRGSPKVMLRNLNEKFDVNIIDLIRSSGLFVVEGEGDEISVRPYHLSILDFFRERYGLERS